jgi:hypothetical protein
VSMGMDGRQGGSHGGGQLTYVSSQHEMLAGVEMG